MPWLREGEKLIIKALQEGPKGFSEMSKKVGAIKNPKGILNPSILSTYLKDLQKKGLIERDIYTDTKRKHALYILKDINYATLFINDIILFLEKRLKKITEESLKETISIYENEFLYKETLTIGWILLTENVELQEKYYSQLKTSEIQHKLLEISISIEEIWDSYKLSHYTSKKRKIIETYRDYLRTYIKKSEKSPTKKDKINLETLFKLVARDVLEKKYPGVSIPNEMVEIEAKKTIDELKKNHEIIYTPHNFDGLIQSIEYMYNKGELRDHTDLTEKDKKELLEMLNFLSDKKNKKVYEDYLADLEKNRPKTLIMSPSGGFKGYLIELKNFLSELNK